MTANENDPPRGTLRELAGWLVAGLILAVGGGYWLAMRSSEQPPVVQSSVPATTGVLPQVGKAAAPATQANRPAAAKSSSPANPAAPAGHPATARQPASKTMSAPHAKSAAPAKAAKARAQPAAKPRVKLRAEQARRRESPVFPVGGVAARGPQMPMPQANGPLVDLGAFSDLHQARLAWREMERAHPALKHYRAWIIANRDWNGRQFYQFQLAAASAMDSQMLCFFLRHRGFRCDVVRP